MERYQWFWMTAIDMFIKPHAQCICCKSSWEMLIQVIYDSSYIRMRHTICIYRTEQVKECFCLLIEFVIVFSIPQTTIVPPDREQTVLLHSNICDLHHAIYCRPGKMFSTKLLQNKWSWLYTCSNDLLSSCRQYKQHGGCVPHTKVSGFLLLQIMRILGTSSTYLLTVSEL